MHGRAYSKGAIRVPTRVVRSGGRVLGATLSARRFGFGSTRAKQEVGRRRILGIARTTTVGLGTDFIEEVEVRVNAVAHSRRRPFYWSDRTEESTRS